MVLSGAGCGGFNKAKTHRGVFWVKVVLLEIGQNWEIQLDGSDIIKGSGKTQ